MPPKPPLEFTTLIQAPRSHVHKILTSLPDYPTWSAYITAIEPVGNPAAPPGTPLRVTMSGRVLNETVIQNDNDGFGWGGQIITPGVFAAKHWMLIGEGKKSGETSVTVRAEVKGVLGAVMMRMGFEEQGRKGMEEFAASLKAKCEAR